MDKQYFFICGCARSGTTALWRLISAHPGIAVGLERYIGLIQPEFSLCKELFEEDRFFDWHEGDTHFKNLTDGHAGKYYRQLRERYHQCQLFGDKIPPLYNSYRKLHDSFGTVKILFIFRNIFDVAQSFNLRARQGINWPATKDYTAAVTNWNSSLSNTLEYIKAGGDVLCLEYEDLFWGGIGPEVIEGYLGLETSDRFAGQLDELVKQSAEYDAKRESLLDSPQKKYIMHHADFSVYKRILEISLSQREREGGAPG